MNWRDIQDPPPWMEGREERISAAANTVALLSAFGYDETSYKPLVTILDELSPDDLKRVLLIQTISMSKMLTTVAEVAKVPKEAVFGLLGLAASGGLPGLSHDPPS